MRLCITLCNVRQVVGRGEGRVQFSFSLILFFFPSKFFGEIKLHFRQMFPLLPLYINTDSPWHNDATYWFHLTRKKRKWKKRDTPAFTIIKKVLISAKSASCMLLQLGWGWHLGRDDLLYWRAGVNTHPLCLFLDRMLSLSLSHCGM